MHLYFTAPAAIRDPSLDGTLSPHTLTLVEASRGVPFFLRDDGTYFTQVNDWLRSLPASGSESPATWRAYAYDVVKWLRFLGELGRQGPWDATTDDYAAYYRRYGGPTASEPLAPSSWNRSNAALESLYSYGEARGWTAGTPFLYRTVRGFMGERRKVNATTRPVARKPVRFLSREEFDLFLRVGLRVEGDRVPPNATTTRLYRALAWLLVSTSLRISEALLILVGDPTIVGRRGGEVTIGAHLRKRGVRSVTAAVASRVARYIDDYVRLERQHAIDRGAPDFGIQEPLYVRPTKEPDTYRFVESGSVRAGRNIGREDRARMVLVDRRGRPVEPALLFLNRDGKPLYGKRAVLERFYDATRRLADEGHGFSVTPHDLRHTYAVHRLHQLTVEAARKAGRESPAPGGSVWLDIAQTAPLRILQEELGHTSFTSTLVYLNPGRGSETFAWAVESWAECAE